MASNTTYGGWFRPPRGGFMQWGKPLTYAGFGVLLIGMLFAMINPLMALGVIVPGEGIVVWLARRDRQNRNSLEKHVEKHAARVARSSGRSLWRSGLLSPVDGGVTSLPGVLSKVELVEALDGFGEPFAVVHHGFTGEWSLMLACQPQGAALVDDDIEDSYVAGWADLLESLASEQGITQVAVTVDTSPDSGLRFKSILRKQMVEDAPELAVRAMAQIMDVYGSGAARSEVTFTVTFKPLDAKGRFAPRDEALRQIALLIPDLLTRLGSAGAGTPRLLDMDQVARMARGAYDPVSQDTLTENRERLESFVSGESDEPVQSLAWADAGPVAAEAGWDWYRHDSGLSRTWEMVDPPQSNVTSSRLARLLLPQIECDRKRVTVVFHLVTPAMSSFLAEQNQIKASNALGQKKHTSSSSLRQAEKAERQADEEADGAAMVFFGVIVTATVLGGEDEQSRFDRMCRAVEMAAGSAKINLRTCYAAQDSGFAVSLPFGLNVRSYKPSSSFSV